MKEKLNFTVEDVTVIKENPNSNFAVLSLDFFASGDNLNDSYVSEETLMRTAETIKNCPLVWKYDERLDDIYTHDKDEVPCGFVPESSEIKSKKLEDGRTMLSVVAYVWRRYTGELLNIFRRDKGKKPVSVEILLYESKIREDGKRELLDFIYEGITILGSFVTPAIPLANATVLSFSKLEEEYQKDFRSEFFSSKVDMEIPDSVKEICRNALEERVKKGGGGTSEQISFAKFIVSNDRITPERVFYLDEYFKNKNRIIEDPDKESKDYPFSFYLLGGEEAHKWSQALIKQMSEDRDNKILNQEVNKVITFPYKSISEVNPALKGIDPPITLGQANEISRQADSIGSDDKKNGWAIAIGNFKKTHAVKDGKWVKKESMAEKSSNSESGEEYSSKNLEKEKGMEKEDEKIEELTEAKIILNAEPKPKEDSSKQELPPKDKEEAEEKGKKKFEFPANFDIAKMGSLFAEEEEDDEEVKMAKAELEKGEFADPGIMMSGMFAKMCKMANTISEMAEKVKVYMEENEELKKFKAEVDSKERMFHIAEVLQDLSQKVVIPEEAMEEMKAEAEKYSKEDLEKWEQYCKARSFDFATKERKETDVVKIGLPFYNSSKKTSLWEVKE